MQMEKIDWKQPIEHVEGLRVSYFKSMESGDFRHLVLIGDNDDVVIADDFGIAKVKGKTGQKRQMIRQKVIPKRPDPKPAAYAGIKADKDLGLIMAELQHELSETRTAFVRGVEKLQKVNEASNKQVIQALTSGLQAMAKSLKDHQDALLHSQVMLIDEIKRLIANPVQREAATPPKQ